MADYIYLLENRLSAAQRAALLAVRELAKSKGLTLFLVGGAVRDLTSGSPVRDLDVAVQGNALKLSKDIEKAGGVLAGQNDAGQALFVRFPGSVRMEIGSTLSVTFPKPGKPVVKPATILEDLRRRDFTANAMALSLNDGSYGLLMDPLNGVADIENRQLRLVSNYGFIEDPIRMVRAARLMARLGWTLDEKTQARYETGKQEGYISALSDFYRGYEAEEIVHEEDPLRVLKSLEAEGWMKHLAPFWTSAKVNVTELERLRETQTQLQLQGIHPDPAAANFPLLTSRLLPKEIETLKSSFPRKGFVAEIEALEAAAKEFAATLGGKLAASPSAAWKLITTTSPEAVLWTAFSSKSGALQTKFKSFYTEWPQVRQKIPYTLMQEMRITKDLPGYDELLGKLFFELMDGHLQTTEEMKAFLEPYSPPAPPPPVSTRRLKAAKAPKGRAKKAAKLEDPDSDEIDLDTLPSAADDSGEEEIDNADLNEESDDKGSSNDEEDSEPQDRREAQATSKAKVAKAGPKVAALPAVETEEEPPVMSAPVKKGRPAPEPAKVAASTPGRIPARTAPPSKQTKPASQATAVKAAPDKAPTSPTSRNVTPPTKSAPAAAAGKAGTPAKKASATKAVSQPTPKPSTKTATAKVPAKSLPAKKAAAPVKVPTSSAAKSKSKSAPAKGAKKR